MDRRMKKGVKNCMRRRKAQAEIADTIAIITIILIVVVYSLTVGNKIFKTIEAVVTSANPRLQAIELSSLFTISAAAPENSKITYNFFKYEVNVSGNQDDRYLSIENQKLKKYTKPSYSSYFASPFPSFELKNTKSIEFGKFIEDNEVNLFVDGETNSYDISSYISSSSEEKYIPLEKYIVCAYKTCEEGYKNTYCPNKAGITTTYNPLLDRVIELFNIYGQHGKSQYISYFDPNPFDKNEKRCGGGILYSEIGMNEYTDQFPFEISVKSGDYISLEDLKKYLGNNVCIEELFPSHTCDPGICIRYSGYNSELFDFEKNNGNIVKVTARNDGIVYLWVQRWISSDGYDEKKVIFISESKPYIDLNDENKATIKYSGNTRTLRRIHYKNNDYIMVFCADCGSGCEKVLQLDADDCNTISFAFCDLESKDCYKDSLYKGSGEQYDVVFITYDGILEDAYGKYMQFTVEGV